MKLAQIVALLTQKPRREAVELIKAELVTVNGEVSTQYSLLIDQEKDKVVVQGFEKRVQRIHKNEYFIFNKPKGVECTLNGNSNALNKYLMKFEVANLKPVGRLDKDSEGLLIVTNDGAFIQKLAHPKQHIPKIYEVWLSGIKDVEQEEKLKSILKISKMKFFGQGKAILEVELQEGQNRQIRRSCASVGLHVERILRTAIGAVKLGELKPGEWKRLSSNQVSSF
jgi:pseudouridine synthase